MQLLINLNLASLRLFPSCFLRCGLHWQPTSNKLTEIGQRGKGCRGRSCTGQAPGTPRSRSGRGRGFWKKKKKKRGRKKEAKKYFFARLWVQPIIRVYIPKEIIGLLGKLRILFFDVEFVRRSLLLLQLTLASNHSISNWKHHDVLIWCSYEPVSIPCCLKEL